MQGAIDVPGKSEPCGEEAAHSPSDFGRSPSESLAASGSDLSSILQSPSFLHRFGLFLEEKCPEYRPLLYFCVDVERLRILSDSLGLENGAAPPSDCEFILWTYFKKATPRSLHKIGLPELGELPDGDSEGIPINLHILVDIQVKAQGVLHEKFLPDFAAEHGSTLAPKDRSALETLISKYNDLLETEAPEAEAVATEALAKERSEARVTRNKYMARIGIPMGGGASLGPGHPGMRPGGLSSIREGEVDPDLGPRPDDPDCQAPCADGDMPKGWSGDSSYQSSSEAEAPAAEVKEEVVKAEAAAAEAAAAEAAKEKDEKVEAAKAMKEKTSLDDFKVQKVLGKGSFGTVVKVVQKSTGSIYAMKVMSKKELIKKKALRHIRRERSVLEYVSHPFVVGLLHAFITEAKVYLVLEYCAGGDLHQHLMAADHTRFPEPQARFYTAELVLALEYLHELGVIYRDLKPENVLLDAQGHVRLADFGLCRAGVQDDLAATSFCGSPAYLSPEMVNRSGHGQATDWWGLGVLLYEMLTGDPPFQGRDIDGLFSEIKESEVKLAFHNSISPEALNLILGLLAKEAEQRLKAAQCKTHQFFQAHNPPLHTPEDWLMLTNKQIPPPFKPVDEDEEDQSPEGTEKKKDKGCSVM